MAKKRKPMRIDDGALQGVDTQALLRELTRREQRVRTLNKRRERYEQKIDAIEAEVRSLAGPPKRGRRFGTKAADRLAALAKERGIKV